MKIRISSKIYLAATLAFGAFAFGGCTDVHYPRNGGYDPYYSGGYRDDGYYDRHHEHELERELEHERREEWEREHHRSCSASHNCSGARRVEPRQEHCPPGFSPSERKCSPEERRHGCKDIRLNSGLGCVKR